MSNTTSTVDRQTLDSLRREGLLNDDAHAAAGKLIEQQTEWRDWSRRNLLFYGGTLTLFGVIYFFAHNWQEMGKFLKFGVIEAAILGCIYFGWRKGFETLTGKFFLMAAAVLIGVLLAVFGQVYQTGADPYELFLGWAALSFGLVIGSKFAGLWFLWFALLNTAAILYWGQVARPAHDLDYSLLCLGLAVTNTGALFLRELGLSKNYDWLQEPWLRPVLIASVLTPLTIPALDLLARFSNNSWFTALGALFWAATSAYLYRIYRQRFRDVTALALVTLSATIVGLTFIGFRIGNALDEATGFLLVFSIFVLGATTGAVLLLKHESKQLHPVAA